MSCVFFGLCWHTLHNGAEPEITRAVTSAILGPDLYSGVEDSELRPWVSLAHDIVASAPADADRMDYMERDSRSFGVSYGLFDRNRLLKSFLCYADQGTLRQYRLGIKRSGLRAVENLVQARFELFVQVYYHKTNRAIELMLSEVAQSANTDGLSVLSTNTLDGLISSYVDLDDSQFLRVLQSKGSPAVRQAVMDIQNRKLWKRVRDIPPVVAEGRVDAEKTAALARHMRDKLGAVIGYDDLHVDQVPPKATKDLDGGAALLQRDENGVYAAVHSESWLQASAIIRTLSLEDQAIVRVYLKSSDGTRMQQVRTAAQSL